MVDPDPVTTKAMEEAVRRYVADTVVRYLPFTLAVLIFVVMVTTVPTRSPSASNGGAIPSAGGFTGTAAGGGATAAGGANAVSGTSATPGAAVNQTGQSGSLAVGSTSNSGAPAAGGGSTGGAITPAPAGAPGVTASGQACGPGVRQVPWSVYSTTCVPVFHGNNGGATSFGVTGSTITVSFRISDSGEAAAIAAASPSLNQAAQDQYFQTLTTYMSYFNTQFELYGRKVVVKEFTGQGDWVQEYQSQDPQGAQADAATARSKGAFADISSTAVSTTPLYAQYLASDHVLSVGGVAGSDHYFSSYAPYIYAAGASISRLIDWVPNVVCQRMKDLPAVFSGDAASTRMKRKFGIIYPTNPDFQIVGQAVKSTLAACGAAPDATYEYALDLSTMASDSTNAMAQMRSKGVTTVICLCDTVVPRFLTNAASGQQYHPEWLSSGAADSLAQGYDQGEWSHAISPLGTALPPAKSEAHKVYLQASHGKEPVSTYYDAAYGAALLFYDALQNAGPNLTPANFQQGFFSLPPSLPGGQYGPWEFGVNHWTSAAGAKIGWYNPAATSGQDGATGASNSCTGADGDNHPWEPRSAYGAAGTQLHCFGK